MLSTMKLNAAADITNATRMMAVSNPVIPLLLFRVILVLILFLDVRFEYLRSEDNQIAISYRFNHSVINIFWCGCVSLILTGTQSTRARKFRGIKSGSGILDSRLTPEQRDAIDKLAQ